MNRDWLRDIRICDGCKTEQYALPRYAASTGVFRGFYCNACEASYKAESDEMIREGCRELSWRHPGGASRPKGNK